ncbi:hypothetical protein B0T16DRAFT_10148 [Cercophora newfieldiana]|uniref:Uncharacterized protein n=1 Tax=Cercophora newfieldiana TaxID=92897 RepID=A0AA39YPH4_9PEZI|nr:hypothetical protein B0T16DRAFT_10148 [Cercophora newfieldiana]
MQPRRTKRTASTQAKHPPPIQRASTSPPFTNADADALLARQKETRARRAASPGVPILPSGFAHPLTLLAKVPERRRHHLHSETARTHASVFDVIPPSAQRWMLLLASLTEHNTGAAMRHGHGMEWNGSMHACMMLSRPSEKPLRNDVEYHDGSTCRLDNEEGDRQAGSHFHTQQVLRQRLQARWTDPHCRLSQHPISRRRRGLRGMSSSNMMWRAARTGLGLLRSGLVGGVMNAPVVE